MLVVAKTPAPDTTPESRNAAHNVAVPASHKHLFFGHPATARIGLNETCRDIHIVLTASRSR